MAVRLPAFAGGPSARRNYKVIGFSVAVALGLVGLLWLIQPKPERPSHLPRVAPNGEQAGMSGSNQQQRQLAAEQNNAAAEQAREEHTTHLAGYSTSYPIQGREERGRAAQTTRRVFSRPAEIDPSMLAGYLAAMNRLMAASVPVADKIEVDGEKMAKERAEILEAALKRRQTAEAAHAAEKPAKPGLGLAGRRVMGHTILANKVEADLSNGRNMPVLVQMDTGPLAGYRLEGSVEKHEDSLSVPITTLFGPGGRKIPVDALLVSPQTQETTVACDVNHHYFARIGIPAVVGAVQGLGQAALLSGSNFVAGPFGYAQSYRRFNPEQVAGVAAAGAANGVQGVLHDALPKGSTVELCPDAQVEIYFRSDVSLD